MFRLLEKLISTSKYQEDIRKVNIELAQIVEKQKYKISSCEHQIELLSESVKQLAESKTPKLEETNRIWKVKEKIRGVIQHKLEDIAEKRDIIAKNFKDVKGLDSKVESIKIELDSVELSQIQHYYRVLQIGLDTRQDGLSWILKALWILGEDVKVSKFPKYLDSRAISFIFDYAKINTVLSDLLEKSKVCKAKIFNAKVLFRI